MSTGQVWLTIGLVTLVTVAIKGAGPALLGSRVLPPPLVRVVGLLAAALLAALVVTSAMADGTRLHAGADTVGVAVAGVALWRRLPLLAAVLLAAAVTALLRLAGLDD